MKITFIGTGSIIPSPKKEEKHTRSYSAILVELQNASLLFDVGPGTLTKLQQIGVDTRVYPTHLFMSHYHIDHCQDYIGLVKGRCFNKETGKREINSKIQVYGPSDLRSLTIDLFEKTKRWSYMTKELKALDSIILKEVDKGIVEENEAWKATCLPVKHYDGVAFRLESEGKSFVYSGDMTYDENLAILGKNADLVVTECSYPDRETLNGLHLCPQDVARLSQLGNFKKVVLTHLYPSCEGHENEMIKTIENNSEAKVTIAHDFLQINL